jgi:hypothetical protein
MQRFLSAPMRRLLAVGLAIATASAAACRDHPTGEVDGPPLITSITPTSGEIGSANLTITVNGRGFKPLSLVRLDGVALPTMFVSDRQLTALLPAGILVQAHVAQLLVEAPEPDLRRSQPVNFTVAYPAPSLTGLSLDTASVGEANLVVIASGSGFSTSSKVRWSGVELPTTYSSPTQLSFVLSAGQLAAEGTFQVTVVTPQPGGGTSAARPFVVRKAVPQITLLPSAGATAGRPGYTLTIHGAGFIQGSSVEWNGTPRGATYLTGSRLEVAVSSADLAAPGTVTLRVLTPGVATPSNAVTLTIRALPAATTTVTRLPLTGVRDVAWDAVSGRLYVSVAGAGGALGNTITRVNPQTEAVDGSIFVGSEPSRLALSDDGHYLYVGLNGANGVRRVDLGSFTAGLQWSLGAGEVAGDLAVMPGTPGTVAVSRQVPGLSPPLQGVTIYDDGVARPQSSPGHTGGNRIEFLQRKTALYGFNNAHTGFEFFTIGIDPTGARHLTQTGSLIGGFYTDIIGAAGRIYGTDGSVVDPERLVRLGTFGGGSLVAVDPPTGRIFAARDGALLVMDMNTFQLLATLPWPTGLDFPFGANPRMVRFGSDGLAFVATNELVLMHSPMFAP